MPTKAINLRIDTELLEYLQKRADVEHRTLSNMIISILLDDKDRILEDDFAKAVKHLLYSQYMNKPSEVKSLFKKIDGLLDVRKQNWQMRYMECDDEDSN